MKIIVREDKQITIRAVVPVNIKDISNELEKVAVRLLRRPSAVTENELSEKEIQSKLKAREVVWERVFSKILASTPIGESLPRPKPAEVVEPESIKRVRAKPLKTKTIEIKLTLPALPKLSSLADIKAFSLQLKGKLIETSPKARVAIGLAAVLIGVGFYGLFGRHAPPPPVANVSSPSTPRLTRGTPNYATVLPAGKTINQLGGWTRVSPKNRNPVYAYIDRIGKVQVSVSEQPLPPGFQANTEKEIAQLAQNFNASEKVPAKSTSIYIATFADDSQSVILSKDKLLVLMKSTALLPPNQWVTYVNSLQ